MWVSSTGPVWRVQLETIEGPQRDAARTRNIGGRRPGGRGGGGVRIPEEWQDMKMVVIPKPGKDHTRVKGWRPIVLANTIGKLAGKMEAQGLQERHELWHERAFAGRKGRGAIDSVMLMAMMMEKHKQEEIIGRDAQLAFNTPRRDHTARILEGHGWLREWVVDWLQPRTFAMEVDGRPLGTTAMTEGTPQRSPYRQPSLQCTCRVYLMWEAQRRMRERGEQRQLRYEKRKCLLLATIIH